MRTEIPPPLLGPGVPQEPDGAETPAAGPRPQHTSPGRTQVWLPVAAAGLGVLAGAAATVSYAAQYHLAEDARHLAFAAALEAAIPDAAALVFACLGVALAVQGRRAVRARLLNAASAGASVFMNVIAAAPGWRNLAVWAMPPAAYALASDTLIGVVRTSAAARQDAGAPRPAAEASFLAVAGGLGLWLLRLGVAPRSTAAGFRAWVVEECPVAPGRRAAHPAGPGRPGDDPAGDPPAAEDNSHIARTGAGGALPATARASRPRPPSGGTRGGPTKTAMFLALVAAEHGPLAAIPVASVARISAACAPRVALNAGSARTALRRAVLTAQQDGAARQNPQEGAPS